MSHASSIMPYFIKPSSQLTAAEKTSAYKQASTELDALLKGETDVILIMSSINCILKTHIPYFYWVGFYCVNKDKLIVGPYQGTLGCLNIDMKKGVCGAVAHNKKLRIVDQVHDLVQGDEHIACDPNSQSEIVLPVFNMDNQLIAVFDVDSSLPHSFDEIDASYLKEILHKHFATHVLTQTSLTI